MTFRVEQAFTEGRRPGVNLDRWVVTDDFAAIFDGATPKHPDLNGATAATSSLTDALVTAVQRLPAASDEARILSALTEVAALWREPFCPSAAGAIFSRHLSQVLVISDIWVEIDGAARFFPHAFEHLLTSVRVAVTERELARGVAPRVVRREDPGRIAVLDLLAGEARFRNVDADGAYFFAAINGDPIPQRLVTRVDVPDGSRRLVLASDGYPRLGKDLEESEALLARIVAEDPLMITLAPGTKGVSEGLSTYDDRTYLALALESPAA